LDRTSYFIQSIIWSLYSPSYPGYYEDKWSVKRQIVIENKYFEKNGETKNEPQFMNKIYVIEGFRRGRNVAENFLGCCPASIVGV
jgi:hypothetical protein